MRGEKRGDVVVPGRERRDKIDHKKSEKWSHGVIQKFIYDEKELVLPSQTAHIMLLCPAEGCTFKAKNDRALAAHRRQCKKAARELALIAEEVEQREIDHRQAKRRRISSPVRLEDVSEAEEPMDTNVEDVEVRLINNKSERQRLMTVIVSLG